MKKSRFTEEQMVAVLPEADKCTANANIQRFDLRRAVDSSEIKVTSSYVHASTRSVG